LERTAAAAETRMRFLVLLVLWCILLVLSWPVALAVLVLAPLVWLVALPFRVVGVCLAAVFALLRALLFLPARVLGYRG
jgi:hypothetical protein